MTHEFEYYLEVPWNLKDDNDWTELILDVTVEIDPGNRRATFDEPAYPASVVEIEKVEVSNIFGNLYLTEEEFKLFLSLDRFGDANYASEVIESIYNKGLEDWQDFDGPEDY